MGDEALYLANQMVFSSYKLMPDFRRLGRQCSSITLLGGGTVLPHWSLWIRPNRYNYAFGVGVRNLAFWRARPWRTLELAEAIEKTKRFNYRKVGARGNMSRELLRDWGIDSEVIGDPCLLLEPKSYKNRRDKVIAVNVSRMSSRVSRKETIKLCRDLRKDGYCIVLIPFCRKDIPYTREVSEVANVDVFENWTDIHHVLDFIANCQVSIGERFHLPVFSATTYTPFIMLEYERPKFLEFAQIMGFEKYTIRIDEMTARRVRALFYKLLDNWSEMQSQLIRNVKTYRRKLREFAARIIDDIESLPDDKWLTPNPLQNIRWRVVHQTDRVLYYRAYRLWRVWHELIQRRGHARK